MSSAMCGHVLRPQYGKLEPEPANKVQLMTKCHGQFISLKMESDQAHWNSITSVNHIKAANG